MATFSGGPCAAIRPRRMCALAIFTALAFPHPVALSTEWAETNKVAEVAVGVTMGIFFHELAHAMIGELKLPATGPEEDTADQFSALMMSGIAGDDPTLLNIATYSALLWYHGALDKERRGQPVPWQGEHAPDIRRFRHTFCLLFGSNPAAYSRLADQFGQQLDHDFRSRCARDYPKRYRAWEEIASLRARHSGSDLPGRYPANTPGGRINLIFRASSNKYEPLVRQFEEGLAEVLDEFSRYFVWPHDVLVEFRDCGVLNAFYHPDTGRITMCYELIEHDTDLVLQAEGIAAAPMPGGDAMSFLHGTWWARIATRYGPLDVTVAYHPNRTYQSDEVWAQSGDLAARVMGAWSAEAAGDQLLIQRLPEQWLPQQFCYYSQAACQGQARTTSHPARMIDRNTMNVDGVVWQRTQ